ncbi:MAG: type III pantothenate kinase [Steroidobacteraceae bacterium]
MILVLDIGNSQIYGGVFDDEKLVLQFRRATRAENTSDEFGLFCRQVLRENDVDPEGIESVAICSVVPDMVHSVRNASVKYFGLRPFMLEPGARTGLRIRYRNPLEVGSDRIAGAIAAAKLFPGKNAIIVDFGTATTIDALTEDRDYLGGVILPGLRLAMESLDARTARLPKVEIRKPPEILGRSTVESIQAGLYHGNIAILKHLCAEVRAQYFSGRPTVLVGTGGFARLFEEEKLFDAHIPELVLVGLREALRLNS